MKDLSECDFLNDELKYYTYIDFCNNRYTIKRAYKRLSEKQQQFYLWYVYANLHMTETYKNIIWEYLNDDDTEEHLLKLIRWYKAR